MSAAQLLAFPIETSQVRAHRGEPRLHFPTPTAELTSDFNDSQLLLGTYTGLRLSRYVVDGAPDDSVELSATLAHGRGHVTLDVKAGSSSVALGLPDGQVIELDLNYLGAIRHLLRADVIRLARQHAPLDTAALAGSVSRWYELSSESPEHESGFGAWHRLNASQQLDALTSDRNREEPAE